MNKGLGFALSVAVSLGSLCGADAADKKYGPGVSDKEIKLGQTVPYSGPASAFSKLWPRHDQLFRNDQRSRRH
jgi:hypothetical protein